MASLAIAGIAYLLAIREFFSSPKFGPKFGPKFETRVARRVVVTGIVLAAVWNIAFLRVPSGADDDIHRYVWDGRLQRLGYNPYIVIPSDPGVEGLHTPETRNLNNPDLPSPYPAGAQFFFRAVTAIQESTFAMKVAFVVCEFAIVFVLLDVLRRNGQGSPLVLAYAWNPLLAIEVAGSGHVDIVGALLLVVSAAALGRRWRTTAAVALGLAVAVKFLPIVLVPLYWKRVRIRDATLAAAVIGLLYVPFLTHGRIPIGSLGTYVQSFRFNGPVFAILHQVAPSQLLAGLAVLVGFVTATWLRIRSATPDTKTSPEPFAWPVFMWPMAVSLLCAPVVFPWYLLWLLPFLTTASTLPIIVWTVSIVPVYVMWHFRTLGRPWGSLPVWVMLVEYGCLAAAGAIMWLRRMRRG
jgi:alpha-1,6-mannosyltransferase